MRWSRSRRAFLSIAIAGVLSIACCAKTEAQAGATVPVELDVSQAAPRPVEALTEKAITRDYTQAWNGLAEAMDHSQAGFLDGSFVGATQTELAAAVAGQQKTGVRLHYQTQRHHLKAVFYAPEGDLLELHDTMDCDLQVTDGTNVIHQEHAVLHYVVLMTPGADRWVIRHLQAVSGF